MYVCICFVYIYATHMYVCIYAHMQTRMNVCECMCVGMCMYLHVCVCAHFMCMCVCALCAYFPACMFIFPYKSFFWMHLYPLSSVGSLGFPESRHFAFFQYLSVISSSCLTASRTVMNIEDRGSLTLCILVGISLIFTLLCVRLDYQ